MPKPPAREKNPIGDAVADWTESTDWPPALQASSWREMLVSSAPKRFTIYEPMALLPAGSFSSPSWKDELERRGEEGAAELWRRILERLSGRAKVSLTCLAVNEAIPLLDHDRGSGNIRRSPRALRILHGDFGPALAEGEAPSEDDFQRALWVSTRQNGITQIWTPRWTMFSRGNVKEKARLLQDFSRARGPDRSAAVLAMADVWAVDLYAGIGYFTFCYASLGMRVLCWEINPWSVEGLRRGALANGWTTKIVQGDDLNCSIEHLMSGRERIVVFLESNERAGARVRDLQMMGLAHDIRHINCGLLPTSRPTWKPAWEMSHLGSESWLHLHENAGVGEIEDRRQTIQTLFAAWSLAEGKGRVAVVGEAQRVKTFAPGVWHCVFDVHTTKH